ncbi:MAG: RHS repeat-associated core domain-containing protein [Xanthomonadales bacterium]|nr:RHS repeat-associated core domain-containing protein [Xanthomonadales bacterium]
MYDDAGNLQDDGSISSTYSGRNRLVSTQGALAPTLYQYNAFGERVYKQGQTTTLFAYDEQGHLLGEYDSVGNLIAETIWLDDTPIATIRPDTESHNGLTAGNVKIFFIHPDHLDTPRTIVDTSNQAIWQWHSDPFGTTPANEDPDNDGNNFVSNLRFPGQYFDIETNTHYNYFRDYEPQTGRYVQSDPIGLKGGINTYSYVGNDSLSYTDEYGLLKWRRPAWWKKTKEELFLRSGNKCEKCGKKFRDNPDFKGPRGGSDDPQFHHVKGNEWAGVIKPIMDRLACILPGKQVRKIGAKMFNNVKKLLVLCQDCHKKEH